MAIYGTKGPFVPTTNVYDQETLKKMDLQGEQYRDFINRIRESMNNIAMVLNVKDSGYYTLNEYVCGQLFFPNATTDPYNFRPVIRKVFNFGALPNAAAKNVAHNMTLNNNQTATRIYGCANDTTTGTRIPLPYSSTVLLNNISIDIDNTNITVTTGIDRTNFDTCYIIVEYIVT